MEDKRIGDWIQTFSGIKFYPFDVRSEEIKLDDIIHSLSFICRFVGHCSEFYSVGQHSVLVAQKCEAPYKLEGLLHDSAEAYLSDIAHPIKRNDLYKDIRDIEDVVLNKIYEKFGVKSTKESREHVKLVDKQMLFTEKRDLMKPGIDWFGCGQNKYKPYDDIKIESWKPEKSQLEFYKTFNELYF